MAMAFDSSGSGEVYIANERRLRLRPWLLSKLNAGSIPGLEWVDVKRQIFRMPWPHNAKNNSNTEMCQVYKEWAVHTGKYSEGVDQADPTKWKTNLRCALHKAKDIEEMTDKRQLQSSNNPFRTYRLLKLKKNKDVPVPDPGENFNSDDSNPRLPTFVKTYISSETSGSGSYNSGKMMNSEAQNGGQNVGGKKPLCTNVGLSNTGVTAGGSISNTSQQTPFNIATQGYMQGPVSGINLHPSNIQMVGAQVTNATSSTGQLPNNQNVVVQAMNYAQLPVQQNNLKIVYVTPSSINQITGTYSRPVTNSSLAANTQLLNSSQNPTTIANNTGSGLAMPVNTINNLPISTQVLTSSFARGIAQSVNKHPMGSPTIGSGLQQNYTQGAPSPNQAALHGNAPHNNTNYGAPATNPPINYQYQQIQQAPSPQTNTKQQAENISNFPSGLPVIGNANSPGQVYSPPDVNAGNQQSQPMTNQNPNVQSCRPQSTNLFDDINFEQQGIFSPESAVNSPMQQVYSPPDVITAKNVPIANKNPMLQSGRPQSTSFFDDITIPQQQIFSPDSAVNSPLHQVYSPPEVRSPHQQPAVGNSPGQHSAPSPGNTQTASASSPSSQYGQQQGYQINQSGLNQAAQMNQPVPLQEAQFNVQENQFSQPTNQVNTQTGVVNQPLPRMHQQPTEFNQKTIELSGFPGHFKQLPAAIADPVQQGLFQQTDQNTSQTNINNGVITSNDCLVSGIPDDALANMEMSHTDFLKIWADLENNGPQHGDNTQIQIGPVNTAPTNNFQIGSAAIPSSKEYQKFCTKVSSHHCNSNDPCSMFIELVYKNNLIEHWHVKNPDGALLYKKDAYIDEMVKPLCFGCDYEKRDHLLMVDWPVLSNSKEKADCKARSVLENCSRGIVLTCKDGNISIIRNCKTSVYSSSKAHPKITRNQEQISTVIFDFCKDFTGPFYEYQSHRRENTPAPYVDLYFGQTVDDNLDEENILVMVRVTSCKATKTLDALLEAQHRSASIHVSIPDESDQLVDNFKGMKL